MNNESCIQTIELFRQLALNIHGVIDVIDDRNCNDIINLLKEQEAVVRCKDCKYAYLTDDGECKYCDMEKDDNGFLIERYRSWDWYCADGERD